MKTNINSAKTALLNVLDEPVTNGGKERGREELLFSRNAACTIGMHSFWFLFSGLHEQYDLFYVIFLIAAANANLLDLQHRLQPNFIAAQEMKPRFVGFLLACLKNVANREHHQ